MAILCGDCGEETRTARRGSRLFRICPSCGTETSLTISGRVNRGQPNLQNVPIRTLEGKRIRDAFLSKVGLVVVGGPPDPGIGSINDDFLKIFGFTGGGVGADADYASIERRCLAHHQALNQCPKCVIPLDLLGRCSQCEASHE